MLELKGLTYQVGDNGGQTDILRGIDLTIQDNAFVVITGPNGGERPPWPRPSWAWSSPQGDRSSGTAPTSPPCPSRNGPSWASAMGFSSPPGSRG